VEASAYIKAKQTTVALLLIEEAPTQERKTAMNNTYEAAEVVEIGKAQEIILGVKDIEEDDNGGTPLDRFPAAFAKFDE